MAPLMIGTPVVWASAGLGWQHNAGREKEEPGWGQICPLEDPICWEEHRLQGVDTN